MNKSSSKNKPIFPNMNLETQAVLEWVDMRQHEIMHLLMGMAEPMKSIELEKMARADIAGALEDRPSWILHLVASSMQRVDWKKLADMV